MKTFTIIFLLMVDAEVNALNMEAQQQPISEVWTVVSKACPSETSDYKLNNPDEPISVQLEDIHCADIVKMLIEFDREQPTTDDNRGGG
ncbi:MULTISPECIES: hypothetical protein [unclassified Microbulbifer]|uniref:hypothetical protein n=1 Tax=unclassified Microbulbifer TaxID=2619833 RepID=UPI0027E53C47|nr:MULTISPECIES: hypothetical protein [unclassified Microbulbifer]